MSPSPSLTPPPMRDATRQLDRARRRLTAAHLRLLAAWRTDGPDAGEPIAWARERRPELYEALRRAQRTLNDHAAREGAQRMPDGLRRAVDNETLSHQDKDALVEHIRSQVEARALRGLLEAADPQARRWTARYCPCPDDAFVEAAIAADLEPELARNDALGPDQARRLAARALALIEDDDGYSRRRPASMTPGARGARCLEALHNRATALTPSQRQRLLGVATGDALGAGWAEYTCHRLADQFPSVELRAFGENQDVPPPSLAEDVLLERSTLDEEAWAWLTERAEMAAGGRHGRYRRALKKRLERHPAELACPSARRFLYENGLTAERYRALSYMPAEDLNAALADRLTRVPHEVLKTILAHFDEATCARIDPALLRPLLDHEDGGVRELALRVLAHQPGPTRPTPSPARGSEGRGR